MKIVLTGASGFIGGAFLKRLIAAGHRVICLASSDAGQEKLHAQWPDLEIHPLRSLTVPALNKAWRNADALIHCGWSTVPRTAEMDPAKDLLDNVYSGLALIEMAGKAGVGRFIFLSSGGTVYGNPRELPITEDHITDPLGAYGISKLTFEHYLHALATIAGMRHLILRPGNIYGRSSDPLRPQGVIEHWMQGIIHHQPLRIWGDPAVVRDYVHIDDLVCVMEAALKYDGDHSVFNVGSGIGTSLQQILDELGEIAGQELEIIRSASTILGGPHANILSTERSRKELGVVPEKALRSGLQQLWNTLRSDHKLKVGN